jgi:hypothetical protein
VVSAVFTSIGVGPAGRTGLFFISADIAAELAPQVRHGGKDTRSMRSRWILANHSSTRLSHEELGRREMKVYFRVVLKELLRRPGFAGGERLSSTI